MTNDEVLKLANHLARMRGPGDNLGAYLGDGITFTDGVNVRAIQLADLLHELVEFRVSKTS